MCGIFAALEGVSGAQIRVGEILLSDGGSLNHLRSIRGDLMPDSSVNVALARRGPDKRGVCERTVDSSTRLVMQSSLLQTRGTGLIATPMCDRETQNVLAFNGEIYKSDTTPILGSDTLWLFQRLLAHCEEQNIVHTLSTIRGPWSLIYWQAADKRLWVAKDVLGRRSLLVHFPNEDEKYFAASSVVPWKHRENWSDIAPGIYSLQMKSGDHNAITQWKSHKWFDFIPVTLARFKRKNDDESRSITGGDQNETHSLHYKIWGTLDEAVHTRTVHSACFNRRHQDVRSSDALFGVLFSGGLDSVLLCTLLHRHLPPEQVIDLCSVCFDSGDSPDRKAARMALREVEQVSPGRKWRLIEIDVCAEEVESARQHVRSLLYPSDSKMDFNIGIALWFAARGRGFINLKHTLPRIPYTSKARVLFSGQGADELFAGYSRHRTVYQTFGEKAAGECIRKEILRLWRRNMGRDDRIISDHGREARFPYLDENVVLSTLAVSFSTLADLRLPQGVGDKICLRILASHTGLLSTACRAKRAIQFGSRASSVQH